MSDLFTKPKMSGVCIRLNLNNRLQAFPFNLICNMTYLRKQLFWPHLGVMLYKGIIFACIVYSASFSVNSICNMTAYRKKMTNPLRFKDVWKGKTFASMLLYASFPLIW